MNTSTRLAPAPYLPRCSTGECDCGCDYYVVPVVAPRAVRRVVTTPTPTEVLYAASVEEDEG